MPEPGTNLTIDPQRLWDQIMETAKFGGTAKGGIVLAIRQQMDLPVKYVGVGEQIDDLELFDPDAFVDALFA